MPRSKCKRIKRDSPNTIDDTVQCQECKKWCHFSCAKVAESVAEEFWVCKKCVGKWPGPSMKTMRQKSEKALAVAAGPSQQHDPPKSAGRHKWHYKV